MQHPFRTVGLITLLVVISVANFWLLQTYWVRSWWWHNTHGSVASVGGWRFKLPRTWYVDKTVQVADQGSRLFGLTAKSQFRRAAFSTDSSTMEVWSGFRVTNLYSDSQEWLRAEGNALTSRGYVLRSPIPVAMNPEKAQCLLGEANSTSQPRYVEYCLLQDAELYVALDATRMEYLAEAAGIIGTGQSVQHDHHEHIQPGTGRVNPQAPSPIDANGETDVSLQMATGGQIVFFKSATLRAWE